jgi:cell division protein FtsN
LVLQAGAYATRAQADAARASLAGPAGPVPGRRVEIVSARVGGGTVYRVLVSGFADAAQARAACARLKRAGKPCFIRPAQPPAGKVSKR